MAINDGTTTSLRGFLGTITGLIQESVEHRKDARSETRVKGEKNETAEVVFADPFEEITITAVILSTFASTYRKGSTLTYNSVNYVVTDSRVEPSGKFHKVTFTLRKEGSMTYVVA